MSQKVEVFDRSKSDIFNVAIFKCSLYMFRETKVRWRYETIEAWRLIILHSSVVTDSHRCL